ncbi:TPA: hypothetical protein ACH3X3_001467 [Trebouxia sp. C0006]
MTADTNGSAAPTSSASAEIAPSETSLLTAWISQLPHTPRETAISQLPWMQLEQVDLTMECIGCNSLARVLKKLNSEKVSSRTVCAGVSRASAGQVDTQPGL